MSLKVFCRENARFHELGRELRGKSGMVEMQILEWMHWQVMGCGRRWEDESGQLR